MFVFKPLVIMKIPFFERPSNAKCIDNPNPRGAK